MKVARIGTDRAGTTAVLTALMLPTMLGFVGLGIDAGGWYHAARIAQDAADSAALSAAYTTTPRAAAVQVQAVIAGYGIDDATLEVQMPPASGPFARDKTAVEVNIARSVQLYFATAFLSGPFEIHARAVARTHCATDSAADEAERAKIHRRAVAKTHDENGRNPVAAEIPCFAQLVE